MTVDANKSLVRDYFEEIWNKFNIDAEGRFVAADIVVHQPPLPGLPTGIQGPIEIVTTFRNAMPDLHLTIDDLFGEGDLVVDRWSTVGTHTGEPLFGVEATGKEITLTGIHQFRIAKGRIAERWGVVDELALAQQLGLAPSGGDAAAPPPAEAPVSGIDQAVVLTPEERQLGHRSHTEWLVAANPDAVYDLYAKDAVIHSRYIPPDMTHGVEAFKGYAGYLRGAFPDLAIDDQDIISEGDRLGMRWSMTGTHSGEFWGIPATGKRVEVTGMDVFRIADGKIQDAWIETDYMTLLRQLGAIPS
jgi:steroid delta-isomerase-like uncharacterized protein